MRRMAVFTFIISFLFLSSDLFSLNYYKEQQKMRIALKKGQSFYFKKISYKIFERINITKDGKGTVIMEEAYNKRQLPNMIFALIGGFHNRDVKVRAAVYGELTSIAYYKRDIERQRYGKNALKVLERRAYSMKERDRNASRALKYLQNRFPKKIKQKKLMGVPDAVKRKNHSALAKMNPRTFSKTNTGAKFTYLGEMLQARGKKGRRAFKFLIKAATYRKGNIRTQQMIVSELQAAVYYFKKRDKKKFSKLLKKRIKRVRNRSLKKSLKKLRKSLKKK